MYAVLTTGGKQIKVSPGDHVRVEKLDAAVGDRVELDRIVLLGQEDGIVVDPKVLGKAKVLCDVIAQDRAKKIRVFKKKRRKNYARTYGHRQYFTEIMVREIKA